MLEGDPGLGKSFLTLDLCARLSTGRPWPDGSPGPGPPNALVLNGEDGPADTTRSRLHALGADLGRVFVPDPEGIDAGAPLRFPSQLALLDRALEQTQARLVVLDPVMAFLDPTVQATSDHSVRRALLPLAHLAAKHGCTVLLVRHLNKSGGRRSVYRGVNSIAFLGTCRSGWLVAPDPHAPARRVLAQVKNNLAAPQTSLAFEVLAQAGGPPTLTWIGPSDWTADDLLAASPPTPSRPLPRDQAGEFLRSLLADGPRTSREVWAAAQQHNLAERTLNRAKRDLAIRSVRVFLNDIPRTYWLLPGQALPPRAPPDAVPDLEEWLGPLREQFPPFTPLDDL
jgi:hypothetical protein